MAPHSGPAKFPFLFQEEVKKETKVDADAVKTEPIATESSPGITNGDITIKEELEPAKDGAPDGAEPPSDSNDDPNEAGGHVGTQEGNTEMDVGAKMHVQVGSVLIEKWKVVPKDVPGLAQRLNWNTSNKCFLYVLA